MSKETYFDTKQVVQQLTVLYEISLAVGRSLDVVANCDVFLKTLMTRKDFGYAAVWLKAKLLSECQDDTYVVQLYAIPKYYVGDTIIPRNHPICLALAGKNYFAINSNNADFKSYVTERNISKGTFIFVSLGDLGFVKLFSIKDNYVFDDTAASQIHNVFTKFATSLEGCLVHHKLAVEIDERKKAETELTAIRYDLESRVQQRTGELVRLNQALHEELIERKKMEEHLRYLSINDTLTGLYNRNYFEQEMHRLSGKAGTSVGIIICDIDGLKLVNDSLGHDSGDGLLVKTASILRKVLAKNGIIARIGGDEFAVLLPKTSKEAVEAICYKISLAVERYNAELIGLPFSLSVGFAIGANSDISRIFAEADNTMYREKLHRSSSIRSSIVQALTKALEARDFITQGHADRIQEMVVRLAAKVGLSEHKISDIRLLAQFHDIGKVATPDHILFKPGPLTAEEFTEMKRHSELGFRIAQSIPELVPIADGILKHHEWWNGQGYPLGLSGEDIPLEARIVAIADAYDAMTSDRPYRKALDRQSALAELKRCSATQFDPYLVNEFEELLRLDWAVG